jgi:hypothetical protein
MASIRSEVLDDIGWARRVNARWVVRHGLKECADAYLNQLESTEPERHAGSCKRARLLVRKCLPGEDPKPWFYAGLFSLATLPEAKQFLSDHWFTAACIPSVAATVAKGSAPEQIRTDTRTKIERIREALKSLL